MSAITTFIFPMTSDAVRITDQNGDPWFIAKDICDALGLTNPSQTLSYLDEDERSIITDEALRANGPVTIINESGLYSLILRSRKPEAKAFKKWVTSEVLPSIRRNGSYAVAVAIPNFNNPVEAARAWADQMEKRQALEAQANALTAENQIMLPKVNKYDKC
jgi:anti-repressor protein